MVKTSIFGQEHENHQSILGLYCFQKEPHCFRSGSRNFHPVWWFTYHILPHIGQALQEPTFRSHRSQNHLGVVAVTLGCAIWCCDLLKFGGMITQLTWTSVSLGHPQKHYIHIFPIDSTEVQQQVVYLSLAKCQKSSTQLSSSLRKSLEKTWFCHGFLRDPPGAKTPLEANCKALPLAGSTESSMGRLQLANLKASKKASPANNLRLFKMVMISCCSEISI